MPLNSYYYCMYNPSFLEMMLGNTKSGSHTPLSTQPSQETTQQYTTSQQLQKSLAHALDSQLNSGGTLRPQVSGLGVRPIQPQPQYQPSPAAVMIGLAPGVRPVPSPMAASAKRMAVISQVAGEINDGKVKTSQESNNARAEAKVVHSADRKGDKTTRCGAFVMYFMLRAMTHNDHLSFYNFFSTRHPKYFISILNLYS